MWIVPVRQSMNAFCCELLSLKLTGRSSRSTKANTTGYEDDGKPR
jgi:hypothetical protein